MRENFRFFLGCIVGGCLLQMTHVFRSVALFEDGVRPNCDAFHIMNGGKVDSSMDIPSSGCTDGGIAADLAVRFRLVQRCKTFSIIPMWPLLSKYTALTTSRSCSSHCAC
jgi:hypothetical protein